jgi:hypothetical protein
LNGATVTA